MTNLQNNQFDFRLNKVEIKALAEMFLKKVGDAETFATKSEIAYTLTPGRKMFIRYAKHQNAQEINNPSAYDSCSFLVDKFKNGSHCGTMWVSLGISNFKYALSSTSRLENNPYVLEGFQMDADFYSFMYLIFGENYQQALQEYLSNTLTQKLKAENTSYLNKMKEASHDSRREREKKFSINRVHQYKRQSIISNFKLRQDFADTLNEQDFNI